MDGTPGVDTGFQKWGVWVTTKMQCILANVCDVFSLFMKFRGPPKEGGGGS